MSAKRIVLRNKHGSGPLSTVEVIRMKNGQFLGRLNFTYNCAWQIIENAPGTSRRWKVFENALARAEQLYPWG